MEIVEKFGKFYAKSYFLLKAITFTCCVLSFALFCAMAWLIVKVVLKSVLLNIWQLPQSLIGWICTRSYEFCITNQEDGYTIYYVDGVLGGHVCLGNYILIDYYKYSGRTEGIEIREREINCRKLSLLLGWFYLPVILLDLLNRSFHWKK